MAGVEVEPVLDARLLSFIGLPTLSTFSTICLILFIFIQIQIGGKSLELAEAVLPLLAHLLSYRLGSGSRGPLYLSQVSGTSSQSLSHILNFLLFTSVLLP